MWVQTEHFTGNGCYETFVSSKNFRITFLQKKLKTNNLEQGQCLKVSWSFLLIKDPGDKKLLCVTVHNIWLLNRVKQTSGSQVFIPALNSYCSRQKVKAGFLYWHCNTFLHAVSSLVDLIIQQNYRICRGNSSKIFYVKFEHSTSHHMLLYKDFSKKFNPTKLLNTVSKLTN